MNQKVKTTLFTSTKSIKTQIKLICRDYCEICFNHKIHPLDECKCLDCDWRSIMHVGGFKGYSSKGVCPHNLVNPEMYTSKTMGECTMCKWYHGRDSSGKVVNIYPQALQDYSIKLDMN